jgi:hypothetical protein|tara:strand:- start:1644 stop:1922 length:279 start_codon:yes stop_codon:yes gene_type:complete
MKDLTPLQSCQVSYIALTSLQTTFAIELNAAANSKPSAEELKQYASIKINVAECVRECYNALISVNAKLCDDIYQKVLAVYIEFLSIQSDMI